MKAVVIERVEDEEGGVSYDVSEVEYDRANGLSVKQGLVKGYIEAIPTDESITIWVNEDGRDVLPVNELATAFWAHFDPYGCIESGDYISGTAVIVGGDDGRGNDTDVPDKVLAILGAMCGLVNV